MVTTIKITCDGVFIQSNSYLTNGHLNETSSTGSTNGHHHHHHHHHQNQHEQQQQINNTNNINKNLSKSQSKLNGSVDTVDNAFYLSDSNNNNSPSSNNNKKRDKFTISFLNPRNQTSKNLNQKFIVYNSKKSKNSSNIKPSLSSSALSIQQQHQELPLTTASNIDVDLKESRRSDRRSNNKSFPRRNSTGSSSGKVMNSHTAAINLQSSGQTAVVGHHRGFSSSNSSSSGDCPWFMPAHPMPPTAPVRQHKRIAPQPGIPGVLHQSPQFNMNAPQQQQLQQQQQQQQQQQPHQMPPHQLPLHMNNQSMNSIHLLQHQPGPQMVQQQQQQAPHLHQAQLPTNMVSLMPKSPNQHNAPCLQSQSTQSTNTAPVISASSVPTPNQTNLMSTSMNSGHYQNHLLGNNSINNSHHCGPVVGNNPNLLSNSMAPPGNILPPLTIPPPQVMSTSVHSGVGNFDNNGTNWNSASSLSPTIPSQRKCEVKLNAMPWFHGSITRDDAEHLLQPREDGLFLVRESTNFPGDYTLCVCFQGKVEHYRVKYLENKLTIDDEEYFENLGQLVAHYEMDADGLCTQLIKCLPKKGKQEFCINSKDFLDKGWVIPESDLQIKESIGKGEFGDVMLGYLKGEKVAVKSLKDSTEATQKFLTEASVMTTLEHENLVKFIGLVFNSKHIYLVTEYMSKGSLVDYLRSRGRQHITRKDQINFAYDTSSGMEYLEAKKVVHRDLAARNVLISEDCIAKVSDFGLAREECYNLDIGKLPIKWTAPEALKGGRFSNKSDMWSFGILLWEIYSFGRVPYPRIPLADVVKHVEIGYKMECPEGCPTEIYDMMRAAWDLNPARRPAFADLKIKLLQMKNITT